MLIEGFFTALFELVFKIVGTLSKFIIVPLLTLVANHFPSFDSYVAIAGTFFLRVINGANFAKEVFLNVTGFPRVFFVALINFFFLKLLLMNVIRGYRFLIRMYYVLRGYHLAG